MNKWQSANLNTLTKRRNGSVVNAADGYKLRKTVSFTPTAGAGLRLSRGRLITRKPWRPISAPEQRPGRTMRSTPYWKSARIASITTPRGNIAASVVVVVLMGVMLFLINYAWQVNIVLEENGETHELLQIVQLLQKMQQLPGYYPYLRYLRVVYYTLNNSWKIQRI